MVDANEEHSVHGVLQASAARHHLVSAPEGGLTPTLLESRRAEL